MNYTIKSELLTVTVSDLGAELKSVLSKDGHEYIWGADERYWAGSAPILFPLCGRILDNKYTVLGKEYSMKIHGFARKCVFDVTEHSESTITLRLTESEATLLEYPFNFELLAKYAVSGNTLDVSFTVKNTNDKELPYMLGWHPGFNLEGTNAINSFNLEFEGKKSFTVYPLQNGGFVRPYGEEYFIENERLPLDEDELRDTGTLIFVGTGDKTRLCSPVAPHAIDFSWSANLPYFCLWKADNSDARYICLEPWSDVPADGVTPENFDTRKMSHLASGEQEAYCYNIKFF